MTVVFLCAPLGILVGLVIGIISSTLVRRQGPAGFLIAQGWSLLIVCGIGGLLIGVPYGSRFAFIDWSGIPKNAAYITIPGTVPLLTHSKSRSLLASIGNEPAGSQFIELKIPPAPTRGDEPWSDWIFGTQRADLSPVPEPERFAAQYRVHPTHD